MLSGMVFAHLLSFGSNLGAREENISRAYECISQRGIIKQKSQIIETAPLPSKIHDISDHRSYLNCVCEFISPYSPRELYEIITEIEDEIGHSRQRHWAPREIDIDILFTSVGNEDLSFVDALPFLYKGQDGLTVPHKEFWNREFLIRLIVEELCVPKSVLHSHTPFDHPAHGDDAQFSERTLP